jgi:hypothetical protein
MRQTLLVVGSKAEFYQYGLELAEYELTNIIRITDPASLFGTHRPILYVAGTGHLIPRFGDILDQAKSRDGIVKYLDIHGLVIMPTLEIAHEFADRLGIDPNWRFRSEE